MCGSYSSDSATVCSTPRVPLWNHFYISIVCPQGVPGWCEIVEYLRVKFPRPHFCVLGELFGILIFILNCLHNCMFDPKCTTLEPFLYIHSVPPRCPRLGWKDWVFLKSILTFASSGKFSAFIFCSDLA